MRYLLIIILPLLAVSAYAGFYDYRMSVAQSPDEFETSLVFEKMYPGSITLFEKGHRVEWEADNISDFVISGKKLTAIMQENIIYLPDGRCNGIVAPYGSTDITYKGDDYLVASTPQLHSFYYLPECAGYMTVPREGIYLDISRTMACEAAPFEYIIRDLNNGRVIHRENSEDFISAVYAYGDKCYFLENDGELIQFDSTLERVVIAEAVENVISAETTDSGITAMTASSHINIVFESNGAIMTNFLRVPGKGVCFPTKNGDMMYCDEDYFPNIAKPAFDAETVSITDNSLLLFKDGRLSSYSMNGDWVKSLITLYEMPYGCTAGNRLYFADLTGDIWSVDLYTHEERRENGFPADDCMFAYYNGGSFYSWEGGMLYKFSDFFAQNGEKLLYKRLQDDKVFYYMIYE